MLAVKEFLEQEQQYELLLEVLRRHREDLPIEVAQQFALYEATLKTAIEPPQLAICA
ncbi:MAG: hypothetical protein F6J87_14755 [Spirulina sp. SIO3F2]|nr:hypothetical protein [Spirulina sp. SIO3F2]